MPQVLRYNSWALMVRAIAAFTWAGLILLSLDAPVAAMILWLVGFAFVDGLFSIIAGYRSPDRTARWRSMIIEGIAGMVVAGLIVAWGGVNGQPFPTIVGVWAIVRGICEFAAAHRLRRNNSAEGTMTLMGVLSFAFGLILLLRLVGPPKYLAIIMSGYGLVFGVLTVILIAELHGKIRRRVHHPVVAST